PEPYFCSENTDALFKCICVFCLEQLWLSSLRHSNFCGMDVYTTFFLPLPVLFGKELDRQYAESPASTLLPYENSRDGNSCSFQCEGVNPDSFFYFSTSNSENFHFHSKPLLIIFSLV